MKGGRYLCEVNARVIGRALCTVPHYSEDAYTDELLFVHEREHSPDADPDGCFLCRFSGGRVSRRAVTGTEHYKKLEHFVWWSDFSKVAPIMLHPVVSIYILLGWPSPPPQC